MVINAGFSLRSDYFIYSTNGFFLGSPRPIVDISTANHVYARGQLHIAMVDLRLMDVETEDTDRRKHPVSTY